MTYGTVNLIFLAVVAVLFVVTAAVMRGRLPWGAMGFTLAVTLVLTAVFDNVIIGVGLVAYDDDLISGVRIGVAPIEDFAYTIAVVVIVTCVSALGTRRGLGAKNSHSQGASDRSAS